MESATREIYFRHNQVLFCYGGNPGWGFEEDRVPWVTYKLNWYLEYLRMQSSQPTVA